MTALYNKETVIKLSFMINLSNLISKRRTVDKYRSICVILGMLAKNLPGLPSIVFFIKNTLIYYLFINIDLQVDPLIIFFPLTSIEQICVDKRKENCNQNFYDASTIRLCCHCF